MIYCFHHKKLYLNDIDYFDQKIDITDKFENGVCFVKLQANNETLYLTVEYQNGYSYSSKGYIQPDK